MHTHAHCDCFNHGHSNGRVSAVYFFVKARLGFVYTSPTGSGRSPSSNRPSRAQPRLAAGVGGLRPPSCTCEGPHQELVFPACRPGPDWDLTLPWIVLLALSVSIELLSSSARVTSVKFHKPLSLTTRHIDRTRYTWVR